MFYCLDTQTHTHRLLIGAANNISISRTVTFDFFVHISVSSIRLTSWKTSSVRISLNISEWTNFPSQYWVLNMVKANIEMDQIGQIQTKTFIPRNLGWGRYWVRVGWTQRMACMPLLVSISACSFRRQISTVDQLLFIDFGKSQTLPLEMPPHTFQSASFQCLFVISYPLPQILSIGNFSSWSSFVIWSRVLSLNIILVVHFLGL